jgi:hypothetical protein
LRWSAAGSGLPPTSQVLLDQSKEFDLAPSDDGQEVAIAIIHSDGTAHAFSAESYTLAQPWADPKLKLTQQTYVVEVMAQAAGETKKAEFELHYLGNAFNTFVPRIRSQ